MAACFDVCNSDRCCFSHIESVEATNYHWHILRACFKTLKCKIRQACIPTRGRLVRCVICALPVHECCSEKRGVYEKIHNAWVMAIASEFVCDECDKKMRSKRFEKEERCYKLVQKFGLSTFPAYQQQKVRPSEWKVVDMSIIDRSIGLTRLYHQRLERAEIGYLQEMPLDPSITKVSSLMKGVIPYPLWPKEFNKAFKTLKMPLKIRVR